MCVCESQAQALKNGFVVYLYVWRDFYETIVVSKYNSLPVPRYLFGDDRRGEKIPDVKRL